MSATTSTGKRKGRYEFRLARKGLYEAQNLRNEGDVERGDLMASLAEKLQEAIHSEIEKSKSDRSWRVLRVKHDRATIKQLLADGKISQEGYAVLERHFSYDEDAP